MKAANLCAWKRWRYRIRSRIYTAFLTQQQDYCKQSHLCMGNENIKIYPCATCCAALYNGKGRVKVVSDSGVVQAKNNVVAVIQYFLIQFMKISFFVN